MKSYIRLSVAILLSVCSGVVLGDGVRVERDIAYLGGDRKETLDVYLPGKTSEEVRFPAVVIIHGGGWFAGITGRLTWRMKSI